MTFLRRRFHQPTACPVTNHELVLRKSCGRVASGFEARCRISQGPSSPFEFLANGLRHSSAVEVLRPRRGNVGSGYHCSSFDVEYVDVTLRMQETNDPRGLLFLLFF